MCVLNYEIYKKMRDPVDLSVVGEEEFVSANIIRAYVATTGQRGGDCGHGAKTLIELIDDASTSWLVIVHKRNGERVIIDQPDRVSILLCGDTEIDTIARALEFISKKLKNSLKREVTHHEP